MGSGKGQTRRVSTTTSRSSPEATEEPEREVGKKSSAYQAELKDFPAHGPNDSPEVLADGSKKWWQDGNLHRDRKSVV